MARTLLGLTALGLLVVTAVLGAMRPSPVYALDCKTFLVQSVAQAYLRNEDADLDQLDGPNDNGIACEELQCPCDTTPIPAFIGDYPPPTPTPRATSTSAPASGSNAVPTPTGVPLATIVAANLTSTAVALQPPPATSTSVPAVTSFITPPSTGDAGLAAP